MSTIKTKVQSCHLPVRVVPKAHRRASLLERLRVECPVTGEVRSGTECAGCNRFAGWGLSPVNGERHVACRLPCASCGDKNAWSELASVVFCETCLERAADLEDERELGTAD